MLKVRTAVLEGPQRGIIYFMLMSVMGKGEGDLSLLYVCNVSYCFASLALIACKVGDLSPAPFHLYLSLLKRHLLNAHC